MSAIVVRSILITERFQGCKYVVLLVTPYLVADKAVFYADIVLRGVNATNNNNTTGNSTGGT